MKNMKAINGIWLMITAFILTGCYKEEHFSMPGSSDYDSIAAEVKYPFPFSNDKSGGVYLIKNGEVDYSRIGTKGFTDFAYNIPETTLSWYEGTDIHGNKFFGSREHKNFYSDKPENNFGGEKFSYLCNDIFTRVFLKTGVGSNWYFYTRMALTSLGHNSRCHFSFEGNTTYADRTVGGFDDVWTQPEIFFYRMGKRVEPLVASSTYKHNFEQMIVGEPFEYELVCVNGFIYCRINGLTIWTVNTEADEHARQIIFRPLSNAANFYDIYIEGDYEEMNMVAWQRENGYATVQSPALITSGNELLLFAEGRKYNMSQTNMVGAVRSNETDIVMKSSTDGGDSWSELQVVKGNDGSVNMLPSVVKDENAGKLFLLYTVDANGKHEGQYHIMVCSSDNNGKTWSEGVEIPCSYGDYNMSTLTGHGIQASDGSLIVPVQMTLAKAGTIATLRSTDGGQTWNLGTPLEGIRNRYANLFEEDGKLVMFIGHDGAGASRKVTYSEDWGATWTAPEETSIPTGNYGYLSSGATVQHGNELIHFTANDYIKSNTFSMASTPNDRATFVKEIKEMYLYNAPNMNMGLTVVTSSNQGASWSTPEDMLKILTYKDFKFRTGNMDAAVWGNTVVCICEGGVSVPYEGLLCFKKAL